MAFSSGGNKGPMAEINVTPLIDVMLVLLIIFMINAPQLTFKVQIDLPQPSQTPPKDPVESEKINVRIEPDGRVTDCTVEREGMQPGGPFDAWCGDLQTYAPEPHASGRMVRRRLVLTRSLSYEDVPSE